MKKTRLISGIIAVLITFMAGLASACVDKSDKSPEATKSPETTESPGTTETPRPTAGKPITTASGLQFTLMEEGDGISPVTGDVVEIEFTVTLEDSTPLGGSAEIGEPLKFPVGMGQMMPGVDEGIALMKERGKAKLVIPPDLAYGEAGSQDGTIPPNATLVFEVELLSVKRPDPPAVVAEGDYSVIAGGVKYHDFKVGNGPVPAKGDTVVTHFTMWRADKVRIEGTNDSGNPAVFTFDASQIWPGLVDGMANMKQGGNRQIVIPPALAFGSQGSPPAIPPDTTLILEMDLLAVLPLPAAMSRTEVEEGKYTTTASGLKYYDLVVGTGPEPAHGQSVIVHYTGWLTDGTKFDSSMDHGQALTFAPDATPMIQGFTEGVRTMKVGGKRQLVIPPELGYGDQAVGGIPANATLIFEVELAYAF